MTFSRNPAVWAVDSLQLPRWISAMLSLTAAGKSLMEQPARLPFAVPTGGILIPATGITCAVTSPVWPQVICAKSPVRLRALT